MFGFLLYLSGTQPVYQKLTGYVASPDVKHAKACLRACADIEHYALRLVVSLLAQGTSPDAEVNLRALSKCKIHSPDFFEARGMMKKR